MMFNELFVKWWQTKPDGIRPSTASAYMSSWISIKPYVGNKDIETFGQLNAQTVLNTMVSAGLKRKSCHDRLALLKMMLTYALTEHSIAIKPLNWKLRYPASAPRLVKSFTKAESKRVIQAVSHEIAQGKTSSVSIAISLLTGLRIGEVCGLRWNDFDFSHKTFTVQRTVNNFYDPINRSGQTIVGPPKTTAGFREVPVHPVLMELLKQAFGKPSLLKGYVLTGTDTPRSTRVIRDSYDRFLKRHKLPDINFHGLRHTFATILIEAGVDVKTVSDIIGHANVSTTFNLYVHPSADAKRKAIMKAFKGFKMEGGEQ